MIEIDESAIWRELINKMYKRTHLGLLSKRRLTLIKQANGNNHKKRGFHEVQRNLF